VETLEVMRKGLQSHGPLAEEHDTGDALGTTPLGSGSGAQVRTTWLGERNSLRVLSVILLLVAWELIGVHVNPLFLPTPTSVGQTVVALALAGTLLQATWVSLELFLVGFGIAIGIGVPIGVTLGRSAKAFQFFETFITIMWATPVIALLPLFVIWFGLTFTTQLLIVLLSAVFPIILNTEIGVRNVDTTLLEMVTCFGATRGERLRYVIWPAAVPYITTGLRVGVGRAIVGVVVAELFTTASGLGGQMTYYANYFETSKYFADLFMFILFSVVVTEVVALLERRYSRWKSN